LWPSGSPGRSRAVRLDHLDAFVGAFVGLAVTVVRMRRDVDQRVLSFLGALLGATGPALFFLFPRQFSGLLIASVTFLS
jgi:hypothetical protein